MGSEVRSGDEERDSSPDIGRVREGVNTATSTPSSAPSPSLPSTSASSPSFHALRKKCTLKVDVFNKFRDRFQFPKKTKAHLPRKSKKACAFAHGKVCFYETAFSCSLRFPIRPFIMELLHHLNIALGQVMPNS